MEKLFSLDGKVALITGSSSGMGKAIAEAMGQHGASVVISSIDTKGCEEVCKELTAQNIKAISLQCDIAIKESLAKLVDDAIKHFGKIDILVCNAGMANEFGSILNTSDKHWEKIMTVNLQSILWLTQLIVPGMIERQNGTIIFMASIAGVRGNKGLGLYGVSKAGLAQLARNLAVELGPENITVNSISPGVIETAFAKPLLENDAVMKRRLSLTPLRRVGQPHEVAGVAVMLASKAGGFITGQNIIVDGGTVISDGN
jgi:NAD(P)-dependent dehydrogenase (short-subunit alcohol dehydrogenase family)